MSRVMSACCSALRRCQPASVVFVCFVLLVLAGFATSQQAHGDERSNVSSDEDVIFFTTSAAPTADGSEWTFPIHGWIFEPELNDVVRRTIVSRLAKSIDLVSDQDVKIGETRVQHFLVDNERSKRIVIRFGADSFTLEPSNRDGHFTGEVSLPADKVKTLAGDGDWLEFEAVLAKSDERTFRGVVQLLQLEGPLVISDIDDTVKITEVTDKTKLIENTFFREFRAVEGMADVYRSWEKQGADFVFVSGSPWQLYRPLLEFFGRENFPSTSFHLKSISLKDPSVASVLADPDEHKLKEIGDILSRHPRRRIILVGDSGERDPEIYGKVARDNPERVERIYIRRVTPDDANSERYQAAFENVPVEKWKLFDRAEELPGRAAP